MKARMKNYRCWIRETRPDVLNAKFRNLLLGSGFKILNQQHHLFDPFGFTALYLLSESHFAIHTFPEENVSYLELTSCVKKPFEAFLRKIKDDDIYIYIYMEETSESDGSTTKYC